MAESIDSQYLTFGIDGEAYAVPVIKVREVLEHIKPTKLPRTADFLKGIINVRGNGIPVVDLRVKFGLPEIPASRDTAILVMEVSDAAGGTLVIGALADEVHEVIELDGEHLESAPRFGTRIDASFISGVGKRDGKFIIVIDIDKVFDGAEKLTIAETVGAGNA
jgi:purine-binding chemotaxis protein CheW